MLKYFLIFLFIFSGCSRLSELIDVKVSLKEEGSYNEVIFEDEQIHLLESPKDVIITNADKDCVISWNNVDSDSYNIYRAYSYPQNKNSYTLVKNTKETEFLLKNVYWSGIHYYTVTSIKNGKESEIGGYIQYSPRK